MAYNVVTRHSDQETPANSPTGTGQACSVVINTRNSDGGYDYPPEAPPLLSLLLILITLSMNTYNYSNFKFSLDGYIFCFFCFSTFV